MLQAKALILHAIRLILRDPKAALQVTLLPYLLAQVLPGLLYTAVSPSGPAGLSLLLATELAFLAGMAWMAVAWHRFILIHESGWPLPPTPPGRVAVYLGCIAAFEVAVFLASFTLIEGMAVMAPADATGWTLMVPVYLFLFAASVLFGRLGAILPAVALGPVSGILGGWRATRGATRTIALACAALFLLEEAVFRLGPSIPVDARLSQPLQVVLQWPVLLFGITLLTSTYLHYVKAHPLD